MSEGRRYTTSKLPFMQPTPPPHTSSNEGEFNRTFTFIKAHVITMAPSQLGTVILGHLSPVYQSAWLERVSYLVLYLY